MQQNTLQAFLSLQQKVNDYKHTTNIQKANVLTFIYYDSDCILLNSSNIDLVKKLPLFYQKYWIIKYPCEFSLKLFDKLSL